jgi:hypothetical protein
MLKRIWRPIFFVVLLGCLSAVSFVVTRHVQSQTPARVPFTVTLQEQDFDEKGVLFRSENQLYAFRADGSQVRILQKPDPESNIHNVAWIVDTSDEKSISIHPSTQSRTTLRLSKGQIDQQFRRPDNSCSVLASKERKNILGYETVRVVIPIPARPGKKTSMEEWQAPALDCFPLLSITTFESPTDTGRNVRTATFVVPGEPAATLFAVPDNYVERSPAEAAAEYAKRFPGRRVSTDQVIQRAEERYNKSKRP